MEQGTEQGMEQGTEQGMEQGMLPKHRANIMPFILFWNVQIWRHGKISFSVVNGSVLMQR